MAGEGDPAAFAARLAASATRHETPLGAGGGVMVWHEWGAADAEPLVLLHGGSGSWTHWIRNVAELSERYRVLAADTPGLSDSDPPPQPLQGDDYPAFMAGLADVVDAGIRALIGNAAFHLCGFSMGSIYGGYVAAGAGKRVKTFTLVGASAFGLAWPGMPEKLEPMIDTMDEAECRAVQRRNLERIMTYREADELGGYLQLANVRRSRVRSHGVADTDTLARVLPEITAPLRGIWGAQDIYARDIFGDIEAVLRAADPDLRFTLIPDAGHWVMYEAPTAFDAALKRRFPQTEVLMIEAQPGKADALGAVCENHSGVDHRICLVGDRNDDAVDFHVMDTPYGSTGSSM